MSAPVQVGDILAGKYVVEQVLGEGGMGVVVAAMHQQLGTRVAVKFLLPAFCQVPEAVGRFLREAQAAVQIQSEHVARVIDVGKLESGAPYMVMEYLRGRDLAAELQARGQLPTQLAVDYLLQACEAIAEAHSIGIVHRDLKPANLFLTHRPDGTPLVKVLDFGISKARPREGMAPNLTATQSVMGSPLYMSPEQLKSSKNVDQRTDIWALGVILHELLSGAPPFKSDTVSGLIATVVTEPPPPLRTIRPDVPEALEAIVLLCLEKDVNRRVQHVGELAVMLQQFGPPAAAISVQRITGLLQAAGVSTTAQYATPSAAQAGGASHPGGRTAVGWGQLTGPTETKKRSPLLLISAIVAVMLFVGVGISAAAFMVARRGGEAAAAASAPSAPAVSVVVPAVSQAPSAPSAPLPASAPSVSPTPAEPSAAPAATANPTSQRPLPATVTPRLEPRPRATTTPTTAKTTTPTTTTTTKPRPKSSVLDGRR